MWLKDHEAPSSRTAPTGAALLLLSWRLPTTTPSHSQRTAAMSRTAALGSCDGTKDLYVTDALQVKHHKEVQQLKQQQEALRALLQQAEQQVVSNPGA